MTIAMLIAHLLGDFVFQWNQLAKWKGQELRGVFAHGAIVFAITVALAYAVDPTWLGWAVAIGLSHLLIDVAHFYVANSTNWFSQLTALRRFVLDQTLHLSIIVGALVVSQQLNLNYALAKLVEWSIAHPFALVGYVFITMPCWILLEFFVHGIVNGTPPDFSQQEDKYPSILERILVTTLVLMGQLPLALMVPLPRLMLDSPRLMRNANTSVYLAKLLASTAIAIVVGQLIR